MKRFLKFLCMCLIMSMAESVHAALPTVKDTVIISAADRKDVTLAEMAENFVDYDVVFLVNFMIRMYCMSWNMKCCSNCMPFMVTSLFCHWKCLRQITSSF